MKFTLLVALILILSCMGKIKNTKEDLIKNQNTTRVLTFFDMKLDSSYQLVYRYSGSFDTTYLLIISKMDSNYYANFKIVMPKYKNGNDYFYVLEVFICMRLGVSGFIFYFYVN